MQANVLWIIAVLIGIIGVIVLIYSSGSGALSC